MNRAEQQQRDHALCTMWTQGIPLAALSEQFGLGQRGVYKVLRRRGNSRPRLYKNTSIHLGRRLGLTPRRLRLVVEATGLPPRISEQELRNALTAYRYPTCPRCGQSITGRADYCQEAACLQARDHYHLHNPQHSRPGSLPHQVETYYATHGRSKSPGKWLDWAEAFSLTGTTLMQFQWLVRRGLIRKTPWCRGESRHPRKLWLYSINDLQAVRAARGGVPSTT